MRRMMYRIADRYSKKIKCKVIINGESIGQVASQTLTSMVVINSVTNKPIIRPVACMDKLEIIDIANNVSTDGLVKQTISKGYYTIKKNYDDSLPKSIPLRPQVSTVSEPETEEDEEIEGVKNPSAIKEAQPNKAGIITHFTLLFRIKAYNAKTPPSPLLSAFMA